MSSCLSYVIKSRRIVRGLEQADLGNAIGCDVRSVARWENGDLPSARHMIGLRRALDITVEEMDELVLDHVTNGDTNLRIEDKSALARHRWTYGDLVGRVLDLERKTIGVSDPRYCGNLDAVTDIFSANPDSWRVLTRGNAVVGVWNILPLGPLAYDDIRSGLRGDGEVSLRDIETLELPGTIDVVLSSMAIDESIRTPKAFALLMRSLLSVTCSLATRGVVLRSICVHAWNPKMVPLCRRLAFREVGAVAGVSHDIPILETDFSSLIRQPALSGYVSNHIARLGQT